jgi:hypothetical protein
LFSECNATIEERRLQIMHEQMNAMLLLRVELQRDLGSANHARLEQLLLLPSVGRLVLRLLTCGDALLLLALLDLLATLELGLLRRVPTLIAGRRAEPSVRVGSIVDCDTAALVDGRIIIPDTKSTFAKKQNE